MPIDFDSLVLSPAMNLFAHPMMLNPIRSQPAVQPYAARGVWEVSPYTIMMENQAPFSTSVYKVGFRLTDFKVPPVTGDQIVFNGFTYTLDAPEYDGQGGVKWVVKGVVAGAETPTVETDIGLGDDVGEMM